MEISVRKLKVKDRKKFYKLIKLIDTKDLNFDVNDIKKGKKLTKAEEVEEKTKLGENLIEILTKNLDDIDEILFEILVDITNLNAEQIEELDIDEFVGLLFKVWDKIDIRGLLKRGA